jgi:hypothetical protein
VGSLNGTPAFVGKAEVPEVEKRVRRHREGRMADHDDDDDDESLNVKDMLLGALIGAGGAVFLVGLLMVILFR